MCLQSRCSSEMSHSVAVRRFKNHIKQSGFYIPVKYASAVNSTMKCFTFVMTFSDDCTAVTLHHLRGRDSSLKPALFELKLTSDSQSAWLKIFLLAVCRVYVSLITFIMTGRCLHDRSQLCNAAINPINTVYTAFRLLYCTLTTFSGQVELISPKHDFKF